MTAVIWCVEVADRLAPDAALYLIEGPLDRAAAERIAREILVDPVVQDYRLHPLAEGHPPAGQGRDVYVFKRPGVMDPVEGSALKAIRDLGLAADRVRVGKRLKLDRFDKTMANAVVDEVRYDDYRVETLNLSRPYEFKLASVKLAGLGDDALVKLSRDAGLSLSLDEMKAIQRHFAGRDPTDVELETIAQTWSEHCKHKTFNARIVLDGREMPDTLFGMIKKVTKELAKPWCLSVFTDNAGVIAFDDEHAICFKAETHNHPSAIDPYGGANTGVGGVIRDVLGCGLGAKPIASTDVFCVGDPDTPEAQLPPGVIHPKRLLQGVVAGVRDYGNQMGIPTVAGAVYFHKDYAANPLVFCGTIGLMPKWAVTKAARTGDVIVVAGGRTGRDGIHGATFSSVERTDTTESTSQGSVQIGNAIEEKKLLDAILKIRDERLHTAITDCGAGGLSSAVGEMGADLGAEVDLDKVPLKYDGLSYCEIWISEAQERMVLAVPPENVKRVLELFASEAVEATPIGRFTSDKHLRLRYRGHDVGDLDMAFLHDGLPPRVMKATLRKAEPGAPHTPELFDAGEILLKLLKDPTIASKEWIIRRYDHEVQGASVVKPLNGRTRYGPNDAAVLKPLATSDRGVAVGIGGNPHLTETDPFLMGGAAVMEAMANVVAVGADPGAAALLDNFSWGNPTNPEQLADLFLATRGACAAARALQVPFISGKDSLYNEFSWANGTIPSPGTLVVSAIAPVPDVRRCVTADLKKSGSSLVLIGQTQKHFAGSAFLRVTKCPSPRRTMTLEDLASIVDGDVVEWQQTFAALHRAIARGLVLSCHDLSEGGLAVAAAEMCFASGLGVEVDLTQVHPKQATEACFDETPVRWLLEVDGRHVEELKAMLAARVVGRVTDGGRIVMRHGRGDFVNVGVDEARAAWRRPLAW